MERHGLHEQDLETVGVQLMTDLKRVEHVFADTAKANRIHESAGR